MGLRVKPASGYCWGANPRKSSDRFLDNYKAEFALKTSNLQCKARICRPTLRI